MFASRVIIKFAPGNAAAFGEAMEPIKDLVTEAPGFLAGYAVANDETGDGMTMSVWESAEARAAGVAAVFPKIAPALEGVATAAPERGDFDVLLQA